MNSVVHNRHWHTTCIHC